MTPIDTAELERLADECREMGNAAHQQPGASKYMRTLWKAEKALREVLAHRKAEAWQPETNILPWVALTIEQMRRFEASSGDLERLGLNGEWIPTDTPLSPGLVYRIKPTPTTEASHGE